VIAWAVATAAAAGLASTAHCAVMCGPLAAFAGRDARGAAAYHGARLAGYALVGAIAGATGGFVSDLAPGRWTAALLSWSLAFALGLAAWQLWTSGREPRGRLVTLGRRRRPPSERIFARLPKHPGVVGGLTALLPCGALYTGLLIATGSGGALGGAAAMATFGVTSALGLGAFSLAAVHLRRRRPAWLGRAFAVVLALGAVVLVVRPIDALRTPDAPAACHVD